MDSQYYIKGIEKEELQQVWPEMQEILAPAKREEALFDFADVYQKLQEETYQLWAIYKDGQPLAAMLTEISLYPKGKVLEVFSLAGKEMASWLKAVNSLLNSYARQHGCVFISIEGRKGWVRALKPLGYQEMSTRTVRRVTNE